MKLSLLGVGLLALTTTVGFAQAAPAAVPQHAIAQHRAVNLNQRSIHQQRRIAKGIRTGRINARQGARFERREASIARTQHRMRKADGGRLNRTQRVHLNRRMNRTGRAIRRADRGARKQ